MRLEVHYAFYSSRGSLYWYSNMHFNSRCVITNACRVLWFRLKRVLSTFWLTPELSSPNMSLIKSSPFDAFISLMSLFIFTHMASLPFVEQTSSKAFPRPLKNIYSPFLSTRCFRVSPLFDVRLVWAVLSFIDTPANSSSLWCNILLWCH